MEREVEILLYAHLRRAGFRVQEQVRVPNGIIDAIAERDGGRVIIEVKGEDKGGYGSAQLNFQVALGQISSRMTDPAASYAVAFPLTPDYAKVLRTFRN
jgi:Holliday junction resolvase-like predicted endonuclease